MRKLIPSVLILNILILFFLASASCQNSDSEAINWEEKQIENGLIWKHTHTDKLFDSKQNINILEVDMQLRDATLVYNRTENVRTSELAQEAGAIAAVNAGFFDVAEGGSVTYIKVDGIVHEEDSVKWKANQNFNGAIIIKKDGGVEIEVADYYEHYTLKDQYDDVLFTGCLLLDEGERMPLPDISFVNNRHPRTCIGLFSNRKILLITVDGRTEQAQGMSLHELTDFLELLGCKEAINLDGGGSTSMWIKDFEESGIVNMPCDNRIFDHEGERAVSNILIIK